MTVNIATDFDKRAQKEIIIPVKLSSAEAKKIVEDVINKMDYEERRKWLKRQGK